MRPDQDESRIIYRGAFFSVGQFRRGPNHSDFGGPHQIGGTLMVFPRTSVIIAHAGKEPVVADTNTVMYYNDGQVYSRHKLSAKGDLCDWFGLDHQLVADAIQPFDPHVEDHPCMPFSFSHGPSDAAVYLLQRTMVNSILDPQPPDILFLEESVMSILRQAIGRLYTHRRMTPRQSNGTRESEVVEAVRNFLALHFEQQLSLDRISRYVHYSPFHLCRIFRKHTRFSIHQYLNQLRLRASLEFMTQPNTDLTCLALHLGYASHSHFTAAFRKTFGITPSGLRNTSRATVRQLLSKISIA